MLKIINILPIIEGHFNTLKNKGSKNISFSCILLFLLFPLGLALLQLYFRYSFSLNLLTAIIAVFSIFVGLYLNLLILIFSIVKPILDKNDENESSNQSQARKLLLTQTFNNITYSVLVSLIIVVITGFGFINTPTIKLLVSSVLTFLSSHLILTLFMVIKRIYCMLENSLKR